jgi:hypothetical protein
MRQVVSVLLSTLTFSLVLVGSPPPALAGPLPDILWSSAAEKQVRLTLDNGLELTGKLLSFDAAQAAVQKADGSLVAVDREDVVKLEVLDGAGVPAPSRQDVPSPSLSAPAARGVLSVSELYELVADGDRFSSWLENESGLGADAREQMEAARSRYRTLDGVGDGFVVGGGALAIAGVFPFVFGCMSVSDTDGIVPFYLAPQVCGGGAAMLGSGLGLMLGPGMALNAAAKRQIPEMQRILREELADGAHLPPPARLHLELAPARLAVRVTW